MRPATRLGMSLRACGCLQAITEGARVQYSVSQDVPKIARDVEGEVQLARLDTVSRLEAKQPEPFGAEPQSHAGTRRRPPRCEGDGLAGPSRGDVWREGDRSRRPRRSGSQANERHRSTPLDVHDRSAPAAPIPEFIPEQRPTATQNERALRRQVAGRQTELHARQHPARPRANWNEQVRTAAQARVMLSEFQRRLSGRIAAHGEALTAAPERHRSGGVVTTQHNGILTKASRGRSGAHGERCNALACGSETPLGSRTDAPTNAGPDPRRAVIVAVVVAKFLRGDGVEQRRDHGRIRDIPDLAIHRQLEPIGGRNRDSALPRPVGKTVAPESPELVAIVQSAHDEARSGCEALYAIRVDQIAQRPRAEALPFEPGERAAARDAAAFGTERLQIVFADRLGHVLDGGAERAGPREGIARGLGQRRDLVASEKTRVEAQVEYVAVDLPASPDDAARGDVEPRGAASSGDAGRST